MHFCSCRENVYGGVWFCLVAFSPRCNGRMASLGRFTETHAL